MKRILTIISVAAAFIIGAGLTVWQSQKLASGQLQGDTRARASYACESWCGMCGYTFIPCGTHCPTQAECGGCGTSDCRGADAVAAAPETKVSESDRGSNNRLSNDAGYTDPGSNKVNKTNDQASSDAQALADQVNAQIEAAEKAAQEEAAALEAEQKTLYDGITLDQSFDDQDPATIARFIAAFGTYEEAKLQWEYERLHYLQTGQWGGATDPAVQQAFWQWRASPEGQIVPSAGAADTATTSTTKQFCVQDGIKAGSDGYECYRVATTLSKESVIALLCGDGKHFTTDQCSNSNTIFRDGTGIVTVTAIDNATQIGNIQTYSVVQNDYIKAQITLNNHLDRTIAALTQTATTNTAAITTLSQELTAIQDEANRTLSNCPPPLCSSGATPLADITSRINNIQTVLQQTTIPAGGTPVAPPTTNQSFTLKPVIPPPPDTSLSDATKLQSIVLSSIENGYCDAICRDARSKLIALSKKTQIPQIGAMVDEVNRQLSQRNIEVPTKTPTDITAVEQIEPFLPVGDQTNPPPAAPPTPTNPFLTAYHNFQLFIEGKTSDEIDDDLTRLVNTNPVLRPVWQTILYNPIFQPALTIVRTTFNTVFPQPLDSSQNTQQTFGEQTNPIVASLLTPYLNIIYERGVSEGKTPEEISDQLDTFVKNNNILGPLWQSIVNNQNARPLVSAIQRTVAQTENNFRETQQPDSPAEKTPTTTTGDRVTATNYIPPRVEPAATTEESPQINPVFAQIRRVANLVTTNPALIKMIPMPILAQAQRFLLPLLPDQLENLARAVLQRINPPTETQQDAATPDLSQREGKGDFTDDGSGSFTPPDTSDLTIVIDHEDMDGLTIQDQTESNIPVNEEYLRALAQAATELGFNAYNIPDIPIPFTFGLGPLLSAVNTRFIISSTNYQFLKNLQFARGQSINTILEVDRGNSFGSTGFNTDLFTSYIMLRNDQEINPDLVNEEFAQAIAYHQALNGMWLQRDTNPAYREFFDANGITTMEQLDAALTLPTSDLLQQEGIQSLRVVYEAVQTYLMNRANEILVNQGKAPITIGGGAINEGYDLYDFSVTCQTCQNGTLRYSGFETDNILRQAAQTLNIPDIDTPEELVKLLFGQTVNGHTIAEAANITRIIGMARDVGATNQVNIQPISYAELQTLQQQPVVVAEGQSEPPAEEAVETEAETRETPPTGQSIGLFGIALNILNDRANTLLEQASENPAAAIAAFNTLPSTGPLAPFGNALRTIATGVVNNLSDENKAEFVNNYAVQLNTTDLQTNTEGFIGLLNAAVDCPPTISFCNAIQQTAAQKYGATLNDMGAKINNPQTSEAERTRLLALYDQLTQYAKDTSPGYRENNDLAKVLFSVARGTLEQEAYSAAQQKLDDTITANFSAFADNLILISQKPALEEALSSDALNKPRSERTDEFRDMSIAETTALKRQVDAADTTVKDTITACSNAIPLPECPSILNLVNFYAAGDQYLNARSNFELCIIQECRDNQTTILSNSTQTIFDFDRSAQSCDPTTTLPGYCEALKKTQQYVAGQVSLGEEKIKKDKARLLTEINAFANQFTDIISKLDAIAQLGTPRQDRTDEFRDVSIAEATALTKDAPERLDQLLETVADCAQTTDIAGMICTAKRNLMDVYTKAVITATNIPLYTFNADVACERVYGSRSFASQYDACFANAYAKQRSAESTLAAYNDFAETCELSDAYCQAVKNGIARANQAKAAAEEKYEVETYFADRAKNLQIIENEVLCRQFTLDEFDDNCGILVQEARKNLVELDTRYVPKPEIACNNLPETARSDCNQYRKNYGNLITSEIIDQKAGFSDNLRYRSLFADEFRDEMAKGNTITQCSSEDRCVYCPAGETACTYTTVDGIILLNQGQYLSNQERASLRRQLLQPDDRLTANDETYVVVHDWSDDLTDYIGTYNPYAPPLTGGGAETQPYPDPLEDFLSNPEKYPDLDIEYILFEEYGYKIDAGLVDGVVVIDLLNGQFLRPGDSDYDTLRSDINEFLLDQLNNSDSLVNHYLTTTQWLNLNPNASIDDIHTAMSNQQYDEQDIALIDGFLEGTIIVQDIKQTNTTVVQQTGAAFTTDIYELAYKYIQENAPPQKSIAMAGNLDEDTASYLGDRTEMKNEANNACGPNADLITTQCLRETQAINSEIDTSDQDFIQDACAANTTQTGISGCQSQIQQLIILQDTETDELETHRLATSKLINTDVSGGSTIVIPTGLQDDTGNDLFLYFSPENPEGFYVTESIVTTLHSDIYTPTEIHTALYNEDNPYTLDIEGGILVRNAEVEMVKALATLQTITEENIDIQNLNIDDKTLVESLFGADFIQPYNSEEIDALRQDRSFENGDELTIVSVTEPGGYVEECGSYGENCYVINILMEENGEEVEYRLFQQNQTGELFIIQYDSTGRIIQEAYDPEDSNIYASLLQTISTTLQNNNFLTATESTEELQRTAQVSMWLFGDPNHTQAEIEQAIPNVFSNSQYSRQDETEVMLNIINDYIDGDTTILSDPTLAVVKYTKENLGEYEASKALDAALNLVQRGDINDAIVNAAAAGILEVFGVNELERSARSTTLGTHALNQGEIGNAIIYGIDATPWFGQFTDLETRTRAAGQMISALGEGDLAGAGVAYVATIGGKKGIDAIAPVFTPEFQNLSPEERALKAGTAVSQYAIGAVGDVLMTLGPVRLVAQGAMLGAGGQTTVRTGLLGIQRAAVTGADYLSLRGAAGAIAGAIAEIPQIAAIQLTEGVFEPLVIEPLGRLAVRDIGGIIVEALGGNPEFGCTLDASGACIAGTSYLAQWAELLSESIGNMLVGNSLNLFGYTGGLDVEISPSTRANTQAIETAQLLYGNQTTRFGAVLQTLTQTASFLNPITLSTLPINLYAAFNQTGSQTPVFTALDEQTGQLHLGGAPITVSITGQTQTPLASNRTQVAPILTFSVGTNQYSLSEFSQLTGISQADLFYIIDPNRTLRPIIPPAATRLIAEAERIISQAADEITRALGLETIPPSPAITRIASQAPENTRDRIERNLKNANMSEDQLSVLRIEDLRDGKGNVVTNIAGTITGKKVQGAINARLTNLTAFTDHLGTIGITGDEATLLTEAYRAAIVSSQTDELPLTAEQIAVATPDHLRVQSGTNKGKPYNNISIATTRLSGQSLKNELTQLAAAQQAQPKEQPEPAEESPPPPIRDYQPTAQGTPIDADRFQIGTLDFTRTDAGIEPHTTLEVTRDGEDISIGPDAETRTIDNNDIIGATLFRMTDAGAITIYDLEDVGNFTTSQTTAIQPNVSSTITVENTQIGTVTTSADGLATLTVNDNNKAQVVIIRPAVPANAGQQGGGDAQYNIIHVQPGTPTPLQTNDTIHIIPANPNLALATIQFTGTTLAYNQGVTITTLAQQPNRPESPGRPLTPQQPALSTIPSRIWNAITYPFRSIGGWMNAAAEIDAINEETAQLSENLSNLENVNIADPSDLTIAFLPSGQPNEGSQRRLAEQAQIIEKQKQDINKLRTQIKKNDQRINDLTTAFSPSRVAIGRLLNTIGENYIFRDSDIAQRPIAQLPADTGPVSEAPSTIEEAPTPPWYQRFTPILRRIGLIKSPQPTQKQIDKSFIAAQIKETFPSERLHQYQPDKSDGDFTARKLPQSGIDINAYFTQDADTGVNEVIIEEYATRHITLTDGQTYQVGSRRINQKPFVPFTWMDITIFGWPLRQLAWLMTRPLSGTVVNYHIGFATINDQPTLVELTESDLPTWNAIHTGKPFINLLDSNKYTALDIRPGDSPMYLGTIDNPNAEVGILSPKGMLGIKGYNEFAATIHVENDVLVLLRQNVRQARPLSLNDGDIYSLGTDYDSPVIGIEKTNEGFRVYFLTSEQQEDFKQYFAAKRSGQTNLDRTFLNKFNSLTLPAEPAPVQPPVPPKPAGQQSAPDTVPAEEPVSPPTVPVEQTNTQQTFIQRIISLIQHPWNRFVTQPLRERQRNQLTPTVATHATGEISIPVGYFATNLEFRLLFDTNGTIIGVENPITEENYVLDGNLPTIKINGNRVVGYQAVVEGDIITISNVLTYTVIKDTNGKLGLNKTINQEPTDRTQAIARRMLNRLNPNTINTFRLTTQNNQYTKFIWLSVNERGEIARSDNGNLADIELTTDILESGHILQISTIPKNSSLNSNPILHTAIEKFIELYNKVALTQSLTETFSKLLQNQNLSDEIKSQLRNITIPLYDGSPITASQLRPIDGKVVYEVIGRPDIVLKRFVQLSDTGPSADEELVYSTAILEKFKDNPTIVHSYGIIEINRMKYLVMERINGTELKPEGFPLFTDQIKTNQVKKAIETLLNQGYINFIDPGPTNFILQHDGTIRIIDPIPFWLAVDDNYNTNYRQQHFIKQIIDQIIEEHIVPTQSPTQPAAPQEPEAPATQAQLESIQPSTTNLLSSLGPIIAIGGATALGPVGFAAASVYGIPAAATTIVRGAVTGFDAFIHRFLSDNHWFAQFTTRLRAAAIDVNNIFLQPIDTVNRILNYFDIPWRIGFIGQKPGDTVFGAFLGLPIPGIYYAPNEPSGGSSYNQRFAEQYHNSTTIIGKFRGKLNEIDYEIGLREGSNGSFEVVALNPYATGKEIIAGYHNAYSHNDPAVQNIIKTILDAAGDSFPPLPLNQEVYWSTTEVHFPNLRNGLATFMTRTLFDQMAQRGNIRHVVNFSFEGQKALQGFFELEGYQPFYTDQRSGQTYWYKDYPQASTGFADTGAFTNELTLDEARAKINAQITPNTTIEDIRPMLFETIRPLVSQDDFITLANDYGFTGGGGLFQFGRSTVPTTAPELLSFINNQRNYPITIQFTDVAGATEYQMTRKVGSGTFSGAYEITDTQGNTWILKLPANTDPLDGIFTTEWEAEIQGNLNHDNIVAQKQYGSVNGLIPGIIIEKGKGDIRSTGIFDQIAQELKNGQYLNWLRFQYQMLNAYEYLHGLGVYQLDGKPENVIVFEATDTNGITQRTYKIGDFGLAEDFNHQMTPDPRGTNIYMSPHMTYYGEQGSRIHPIDDLAWLGYITEEAYVAYSPRHHTREQGRIIESYRDFDELQQQKLINRALLPNDVPLVLQEYVFRLITPDANEQFQTATEAMDFLMHTVVPELRVNSRQVERKAITP